MRTRSCFMMPPPGQGQESEHNRCPGLAEALGGQDPVLRASLCLLSCALSRGLPADPIDDEATLLFPVLQASGQAEDREKCAAERSVQAYQHTTTFVA